MGAAERQDVHPPVWQHAKGVLTLDRPRVLGIVNVTPDSFSDGGQYTSLDAVRRRVEQLVEEGADAIDIGGESTRPQGAVEVAAEEEIRRVIPAVGAVLADHPGLLVSVDTVKAVVAREALQAGAAAVNDVSAFRLDNEMAGVCARTRAGVVLMHSRGSVSEMATFRFATYGQDVVQEVLAELEQSVAAALSAGIDEKCIVLDPGIGFSKRPAESLAILAGLDRFVRRGFPVLVGVSRKRFIGEITGVAAAAGRDAGTVGANVAALERGARLFRVHSVAPHRQALDVAWAIMQAGA